MTRPRRVWLLLCGLVPGALTAIGQRTTDSENRKVHRAVIEVKAEAASQWEAVLQYRIATNAMLADGGHHYRALSRGVDRRQLEAQYDII
ncbi:MAG: hypothetical protein SGI92_20195 [Bryobacteraceae bacterium]|nr:hypothetical protein [Bryobacteraceae bacterium]